MTRNARELTLSLAGGKWNGDHGLACCPAHDDRDPSLSINEQNGRVLFHCQAGCSQDAVISKLKERGLWGERSEPIAEYIYEDENGNPLYCVVRKLGKKFYQQRYNLTAS